MKQGCKICGNEHGQPVCDKCGQFWERAVSSVQSSDLFGKIRTAWCHYNALNAELEYSLSEGGDTDVTRDQVEHAWEDLNSLIMPN